MTECEEPNCTRPVSKDWKGKKVCSDCYDKYRENYERQMMELSE